MGPQPSGHGQGKEDTKKARCTEEKEEETLPSGLVLNKKTARTIKVRGKTVKLESTPAD